MTNGFEWHDQWKRMGFDKPAFPRWLIVTLVILAFFSYPFGPVWHCHITKMWIADQQDRVGDDDDFVDKEDTP